MKETINNKQRERERKMQVSDFIDANIDQISVDYLEDHPEDGYKINDGDLDCVYDYANGNKQLYADIMCDIYMDNILF